jgi:hypothetical protein
MPVHAVRLHERHRGGDCTEQLVGDRDLRGRRCRARLGRRGSRRVPVARDPLEQTREPAMGGDDIAAAALEELAPLGRDRVRILEVVLEQVTSEARVQPIDVGH